MILFTFFRNRSILYRGFSWFFWKKIHIKFVGNKANRWISKRLLQENKARQIFRKTNISYPFIRTRMCAYQGIRHVRFSDVCVSDDKTYSFFGKFDVLFFLVTNVFRFDFLPYYRRVFFFRQCDWFSLIKNEVNCKIWYG